VAKYNENSAFGRQQTVYLQKIERYYNNLRVKFVSWPINGIFRANNELKGP